MWIVDEGFFAINLDLVEFFIIDKTNTCIEFKLKGSKERNSIYFLNDTCETGFILILEALKEGRKVLDLDLDIDYERKELR